MSLVGYIVMREEVLQTDIRFDLHCIDIPDMTSGITGSISRSFTTFVVLRMIDPNQLYEWAEVWMEYL